LAVAGYVAGGRAALDALRRAQGDALAGPPRPRRRDVLRHLASVLFKDHQPGAARSSTATNRRSGEVG
jgi:hypothetical protein